MSVIFDNQSVFKQMQAKYADHAALNGLQREISFNGDQINRKLAEYLKANLIE